MSMYYGYRCYNKDGEPLGWLYTYSNNTEYTWTNKDFDWCKKWKTQRGARKQFDSCNARWKFVSKGGFLKIELMPCDDDKPIKIQLQEDKFIRQLNQLYSIEDDDLKVEKLMKLKLAEMLASLQVGENVRYYSNLSNALVFELVQVEQIIGNTIIIRDMKFRRIDGYAYPEIKGYIMPDDDELCKYLIALWNILNTKWGNISINKILKVAEFLSGKNK
jgi:hypothetical protein